MTNGSLVAFKFHSSVGLPRSLGDGFDDSFVSDGGLGGIGEGDTGYVYFFIHFLMHMCWFFPRVCCALRKHCTHAKIRKERKALSHMHAT